MTATAPFLQALNSAALTADGLSFHKAIAVTTVERVADARRPRGLYPRLCAGRPIFVGATP